MKFRIVSFYALMITLLVISCDSSNDSDFKESGEWVQRASFPGTGRSHAVCFTIGDYAYVGTGYDTENDKCFTDFRRYNVTLDQWSEVGEVASLPGIARRSAVAFSAGGKGYVGTGFDGDVTRLSDFWEYNPDQNSWSKIADFPGGTRVNAIAFGNGKFGYVGMGYGENRTSLPDFWKFNSDNGEWEKLSNGPKVGGASVVVIKEKAYVFLGANNGISNDNLYMFDINTEQWERKHDLDDDILSRGTDAVAFTLDGKGYIATGSRNAWEYNPSKDQWLRKTSNENEVGQIKYSVGFTINNRGFVVTGVYGLTDLKDLWEFIP